MIIKNNKLGNTLGIVLLIFSCSVSAGTIIEFQNKGELTTMLTDGKQARLNMSSQEYVIIDYRKHLVKVINKSKQQVMVLDVSAADKSGSSKRVNVSLKSLGDASDVAGYKTEKLEYSANGKLCGVILASKSAYQQKGIKDLISAMQTMVKKQRAVLGGFVGFVDDCTLADMQLTEQVSTIGLPMRTVKNGAVETEINSIKVDVALPKSTFAIPAAYKTITMDEQIKQATQGMQNMNSFKRSATQQSGGQPSRQPNMQPGMQQAPQYQDLMRQMQQSGQLTPEMMEQMRHSQQMMQQYQQR